MSQQCVCACACACARARVRVRVCACACARARVRVRVCACSRRVPCSRHAHATPALRSVSRLRAFPSNATGKFAPLRRPWWKNTTWCNTQNKCTLPQRPKLVEFVDANDVTVENVGSPLPCRARLRRHGTTRACHSGPLVTSLRLCGAKRCELHRPESATFGTAPLLPDASCASSVAVGGRAAVGGRRRPSVGGCVVVVAIVAKRTNVGVVS